MTKEILYVDMDGVLADFEQEMHNILPGVPIGDGPDYEERSLQVIAACQRNPNTFLRLKPIKGGIDAVIELMDHYDVYFLSTPMDELSQSHKDKRDWLDRYFGALANKRLNLTHRKDLQIGDYLIDDTKRNGAGQFRGEHIHFGSESFPDWDVVKNYLLGIAKSVKQAA